MKMSNHILDADQWLLIARDDLNSAKHLFKKELLTSLFHIQQCAEKSLKAFLVAHQAPIIKTHDLSKINKACTNINQDFAAFIIEADILSELETAGRYPDSLVYPSPEDIERFIAIAEDVFRFVLRRVKPIMRDSACTAL